MELKGRVILVQEFGICAVFFVIHIFDEHFEDPLICTNLNNYFCTETNLSSNSIFPELFEVPLNISIVVRTRFKTILYLSFYAGENRVMNDNKWMHFQIQ